MRGEVSVGQRVVERDRGINFQFFPLDWKILLLYLFPKAPHLFPLPQTIDLSLYSP